MTALIIIQNHHKNVASGAFENMAKFKYLGTALKNRNLIRDEIKSK
jgi:hypothetical protein